MSAFKGLQVQVSIDGIGFSIKDNKSKEVYVGKALGGYIRKKSLNLKKYRPHNKSGTEDQRGKYFNWKFIYQHQSTGNFLDVYTQRITSHLFVPSLYAFFYSSFDQPLGSIEMQYVLAEIHNKSHSDFHLSHIHLASDLIVPKKTKLFNRICRSINPLKKRTIISPEEYEDTLYLGSTKSSNQVVVYDKGNQLRGKPKGRLVEADICRVEVRMKMSQLKNRYRTLEDIKRGYWASFIYGRFFSLDHPRLALKVHFGERVAKMPIYKIKDHIRREFGKLPHNFHRDYIREHRKLGPAVRKALAAFRWY